SLPDFLTRPFTPEKRNERLSIDRHQKWSLADLPESVENLYKKRKNVTCVGLQVDNVGKRQYHSTNPPDPHIGGVISYHQADEELGALLKGQKKGVRVAR